ncbi:hypothetical protein OHA77_22920 [Streptosporangium sp. NBC_01639]|uniref:hypothetical protein n=1 Tax=unclassified Streptosporangium TaxID=2632669 RepID=UPI002DDB956B|nr:hypothetical protein [Streptosporangium sp. NBC_01756]WSC89836.1 hypothetical protein OIE48_17125 [Streptosporangium sp. NBC_01756]WTD51535.1 hypothetical protein OHA77_22920 [Streptosporangium sp. NBC_01639]
MKRTDSDSAGYRNDRLKRLQWMSNLAICAVMDDMVDIGNRMKGQPKGDIP